MREKRFFGSQIVSCYTCRHKSEKYWIQLLKARLRVAEEMRMKFIFRLCFGRLELWFTQCFIFAGSHNFLVLVGAAGVGCGHSRGALLGIPGRVAVLRGAADGQGVDTARVAVTVAVVAVPTPITRRPHIDHSLTTTTLAQ